MASISTIWKPAGRAWNGSYHGCATSSGRMANMPPQSRNRNRAANPADTREKVEQPEPAKPAWMPAYEALRQDWNSLIEDARQAGIPSFYAKGYIDIIPRIRELTENPDIPAKSRAPLIQVLENHQRYLSTRKHILDYPGEAERHMDARAISPGRCGVIGNRADRGSGLRGLAAGGRAPDGGGRGHALRQGNPWRPS